MRGVESISRSGKIYRMSEQIEAENRKMEKAKLEAERWGKYRNEHKGTNRNKNFLLHQF